MGGGVYRVFPPARTEGEESGGGGLTRVVKHEIVDGGIAAQRRSVLVVSCSSIVSVTVTVQIAFQPAFGARRYLRFSETRKDLRSRPPAVPTRI